MAEITKSKANKRILSVFLGMLVLFSVLAFASITSFAATSGDYEYTVLSDGTAEITAYNGNATSLTIPSKLGNYAVTSIGDYAFSNCKSLTSVTIPNGVKSIRYYSFSRCTKLTSITIPKSVTRIEPRAFWGCSSLKGITIPNSVTSIEDMAFEDCSSLTNITLPNSVISIGGDVFYNTAYYNNKSNWVTNALYIGKHLIEVKDTISGSYPIKNGTLTIANGAFYNCSKLTSVTIPNSIASIGFGAFSNCESLKNVYFTGTKEQWNKIEIDDSDSDVAEGENALKNATIHYNYGSASQLSTPKLSSVANAATGVKVTWGKVTGAEKYRVFYKANGESTWHKAGDTTATSYTWTGAKSGTKYAFTVRCISSDGKTYTSSYDNTGKSLTYIAAPKLSSVSNVVAGVKVSWSKVSGAAKYRVFYKANGESTWHKAGDTTSTSYTWKKAKNNTKYSFTVRCISKDGKTYTSSYDSKGKSITFLSAPTVKVSNVVAGVKISWNKASGAANYVVFRKTPNGTYKKIGTTTGTSFTDKTAKNNTKYVYAVRCATKDGKTYTSSYNPGKSITFLSAPKVTVSKTSLGVQVKWDKVTGAVNYKVYRKTAGGSYKAIGTTTSTSYVDKTAKKGTKYTYAVRCVTKNGKATTSSYNAGKSITR